MVEQLIRLCDICKERLANARCFICNKDICKEHNFGGENANVQISATVYNEKVFDVIAEDKFIDCCSDCTDKLKNIMSEKKLMIEEKLKINLKYIKNWLLEEIKKS